MSKQETTNMSESEDGKENVGGVGNLLTSVTKQVVQPNQTSFISGPNIENSESIGVEILANSYLACIRRISLDSPSTTPKQICKRSKYSTGSPGSRTPLKSKTLNAIPFDSNFGKTEISGSNPSPNYNVLTESNFQQSSLNPTDTQGSPSEKVMRSIELGVNDSLLIGDYSRRHALPIVEYGKSPGLNEISGATLSALISGEFNALVDRYDIIDCRYPYEYAGGHIRGAENLYTQKKIYENYFGSHSQVENLVSASKERIVLIFHCEFSSERGPQMCRFLRQIDREHNKMDYPALKYPEMYVLSEGYKLFFGNHPEHCEPRNYTPMDDPAQIENLRFYRNETKNGLLKPVSSKQLKSKAIKRLLL